MQQIHFISSFIEDKEAKILDVGCAKGELTIELSKLGYWAYGIDLDESMVKVAKKNATVNTSFNVGNMLELDHYYNNQSINCVTCFGNTLVHLSGLIEIEHFLNLAYSILSEGGVLLIQLLNYEYIIKSKITSLPLIDNLHIKFERKYHFLSNEKIEFNTELLIKDTGEVITNSINLFPVTAEQLQQLLEKVGFYDIELFGGFDKGVLMQNNLPLVIKAIK